MTDKKQRAPRSDSKLLQACLEGDLAAVRERVVAGANVNAGRKDKHPPLEIAARCGHLSIVRELVAQGADVNQIHKVNHEAFPTSALIGAIKRYRFQIAQELVRAGASTAFETHPGCNAASEAAFKAIEYWWLADKPKTSLSKRARLAATFKQIAHLVIDRPPQTFDDWFGFLKKAVDSGAKVNEYCLWEACKMGCLPVVQYLISIGSNVNYMAYGMSALQLAILHGCDDAALALIAAGADPNLLGSDGDSPMKMAVANERHAIISALLAAGAEPL